MTCSSKDVSQVPEAETVEMSDSSQKRSLPSHNLTDITDIDWWFGRQVEKGAPNLTPEGQAWHLETKREPFIYRLYFKYVIELYIISMKEDLLRST